MFGGHHLHSRQAPKKEEEGQREESSGRIREVEKEHALEFAAAKAEEAMAQALLDQANVLRAGTTATLMQPPSKPAPSPQYYQQPVPSGTSATYCHVGPAGERTNFTPQDCALIHQAKMRCDGRLHYHDPDSIWMHVIDRLVPI
eukprot:COSAG06_NODE_3363_length_5452_cov_9.301513_3_plen_144_part_00